jgi:hypothetical protein
MLSSSNTELLPYLMLERNGVGTGRAGEDALGSYDS